MQSENTNPRRQSGIASTPRADHTTDIFTETDMNVLTGAIVEKSQKGERKPTVRKRSKKFGVYLLKDFDFVNMFGND